MRVYQLSALSGDIEALQRGGKASYDGSLLVFCSCKEIVDFDI